MVTLFAGMGLGITANRYVALHRNSNPDAAGQIIGMTTRIAWITAVVASALFFISASQIATYVSAPSLDDEVRLCAVLILLAAVTGAYSGVLTGLESFKDQAIISMLVALIQAPLIIWGVSIAGVVGGLVAMIAAASLSLALSVRSMKRRSSEAAIAINFRWDAEQRRILQEFTLPALMGAVMVIPVFWVGNVFLASVPDGYDQLGLFAASNHWRQAVLIAPNIIASVSLPILSNLLGSGKNDEYALLLRSNLLLVCALTLLPAVALGVLSPYILALYGPKFASGLPVMWLLLVAAVLAALANTLGQSITSAGRMWVGLALNAVWAAVFIVLSWQLCPKHGAAGLAMAYAGSYATHVALSFVVYLRLKRSVTPSASG